MHLGKGGSSGTRVHPLFLSRGWKGDSQGVQFLPKPTSGLWVLRPKTQAKNDPSRWPGPTQAPWRELPTEWAQPCFQGPHGAPPHRPRGSPGRPAVEGRAGPQDASSALALGRVGWGAGAASLAPAGAPPPPRARRPAGTRGPFKGRGRVAARPLPAAPGRPLKGPRPGPPPSASPGGGQGRACVPGSARRPGPPHHVHHHQGAQQAGRAAPHRCAGRGARARARAGRPGGGSAQGRPGRGGG